MIEIEHYKDVLEQLKQRIEFNHKRYGVSYLDESFGWLYKRLEGELKELYIEISCFMEGESNFGKIRDEAIDVAIVGLLIADYAMKWRFNK